MLPGDQSETSSVPRGDPIGSFAGTCTGTDARPTLFGAQDAVSPISSLPAELLLCIFEAAHAGHDDDQPADVVTAVSLLVSHVSAQWRRLALGCASLWTTLRPRCTHQDLLNMCLARARAHALDVTVDPAGWTLSYAAHHNFLVYLLHTLAPRYRTLRYWPAHGAGAARTAHIDMTPLLHAAAAPRLHTLELRGRAHGAPSDWALAVLGGGAPRLRHAVLQHSVRPWRSPAVFARLASLELELAPAQYPPLAALRAFLMRSPGLERLALRGVKPAWHAEAQTCAPIALARLHTLRVCASTADAPHVHALIAVLEAPALRRLALAGLGPAETGLLDACLGRDGCKFPQLRALKVHTLGTCLAPRTMGGFPLLERLAVLAPMSFMLPATWACEAEAWRLRSDMGRLTGTAAELCPNLDTVSIGPSHDNCDTSGRDIFSSLYSADARWRVIRVETSWFTRLAAAQIAALRRQHVRVEAFALAEAAQDAFW